MCIDSIEKVGWESQQILSLTQPWNLILVTGMSKISYLEDNRLLFWQVLCGSLQARKNDILQMTRKFPKP